jgi:hypothetical protein
MFSFLRLRRLFLSLIMALTFAAGFYSSGLLGPKWLDSSGLPLLPGGLHYPVVTSSGPPTAPVLQR